MEIQLHTRTNTNAQLYKYRYTEVSPLGLYRDAAPIVPWYKCRTFGQLLIAGDQSIGNPLASLILVDLEKALTQRISSSECSASIVMIIIHPYQRMIWKKKIKVKLCKKNIWHFIARNKTLMTIDLTCLDLHFQFRGATKVNITLVIIGRETKVHFSVLVCKYLCLDYNQSVVIMKVVSRRGWHKKGFVDNGRRVNQDILHLPLLTS